MKNALKWGKWLGLGAVVMMSVAGCGGNGDTAASDNAVPDSIESPVMDQKDDKAIAGSDNSASNAAGNAAGNSAAGNSASNAAGGNTATR